MSSAKLILVPTPIAENLPLEPVAREILAKECLLPEVGILVEEHKVARRRWIEWGLPREAIDRFVLLNEHTQGTNSFEQQLVKEMKSGKRFYLMSDAGLPAFCDPGQKLVNACHEAGITVGATPFPNSIALALALSGFPHARFYFAGFVPANAAERKRELERLSKNPETLILMDTPYRLGALMEDLAQNSAFKKRKVMLALSLNGEDEIILRGDAASLAARAKEHGKRNFILVISPH